MTVNASVVLPVTPSVVAAIFVVPLPTTVANPVDESMVATLGSDDDQVNSFPEIVAPEASKAVAVN